MAKTSTKLLVIVMTTAAIITMATTTSLSVATPAFAKENCTTTSGTLTCNGGSSLKSRGICETFPICHGGSGQHQVIGSGVQTTISGGGGGNTDFGTLGSGVGGSGGHRSCDDTTCTQVGGSGRHDKGPGGNSVNAPP
jgi:hypothetical protein